MDCTRRVCADLCSRSFLIPLTVTRDAQAMIPNVSPSPPVSRVRPYDAGLVRLGWLLLLKHYRRLSP